MRILNIHSTPRASSSIRVRSLAPWLATTILMSAAQAQILDNKLLPSDGHQYQRFGTNVALVPGWAFCAAPTDNEVFPASGAVYIYQNTGLDWTFVQKLKASDPALGAELGSGLAADGPWLVATTPLDDPQGYDNRGAAHVYQLQLGSWVHSQKLLASDFADPTQEFFGSSADVSGERMVIGEDGDDTKSYNAGSAYVFEFTGSTWVEVGKLYPSDWEFGANFGGAVAIDGDTLVVGASQEDNGFPGTPNRGAAYVFERAGGNWVETQKLTGSDIKQSEYFGWRVAIDGDTILVGSGHTHSTSHDGAMYVFERQSGAWVQTKELLVSDPQGGPQMGYFVALDGDLALGSADVDTDLGSNSGSSYLFRRSSTGSWLQIAKVLAPDGEANQLFGGAVSIAGNQVLIGSWADQDNGIGSGSAYVFEIAPDAIQYGSCPAQGPCGNNDDFGGCRTSSGQGGVLSAAGSSSVSSDDLRFEARWLPANKLGLFFMGGVATFVPFADGRLCTASGGAGVWRFNPPQSSGANGVLSLGPNVVGLSSSLPPGGHIAAGQTWHFQAWFRDPAGPCGMGSNMTNAVRVTFGP